MSDGAVAGSWARIVATLKERTPASARWINGPADAGTLERLRSEIGLPLPPDLTEWLSLANGAAPRFDALIIPRFMPYDADRIIAANRMHHQIYAGSGALGTPGQPAGTETDGWWPEEYRLFIPVATDGGGHRLVVDLRDGDLRGCVMEWKQDGGLAACWPGIAVMLADIAGALEHGRRHAGLAELRPGAGPCPASRDSGLGAQPGLPDRRTRPYPPERRGGVRAAPGTLTAIGFG